MSSNISTRSIAKQVEPLIISVHVPKTAGTSFRHSLQDYFGNSLLLKYGEKPFNTPVIERNRNALEVAIDNLQKDFLNVKCIHGHYLPVQFLLLANTRPLSFVTWVRHPVERLISDYFHTLRNYENKAALLPFQKKIIIEKWSLEKYCLCEELRNVYQQFFWGFPLEYFDFIGITEHYSEDFIDFQRLYLSPEIRIYQKNINNSKVFGLEESVRNKVEQFHQHDMDIYHRAIAMRIKRIKTNLQS